ncbi:MAG TPA: hypothetical protein VEG30_01570 [Terriglobales bacterium]|nr:hypothetical protein [Terriglobales bacterium]
MIIHQAMMNFSATPQESEREMLLNIYSANKKFEFPFPRLCLYQRNTLARGFPGGPQLSWRVDWWFMNPERRGGEHDGPGLALSGVNGGGSIAAGEQAEESLLAGREILKKSYSLEVNGL